MAQRKKIMGNTIKQRYRMNSKILLILFIIYMLRTFISKNVIFVAIMIFLVIFGIAHVTRARFLYNQDGSIRQFGVGYRNKTIMPIWLFSIILGIFSYLAVLFYLRYPTLFQTTQINILFILFIEFTHYSINIKNQKSKLHLRDLVNNRVI